MNTELQCSLCPQGVLSYTTPPDSCIATIHLDRWGYALLMGWATTTPREMTKPTTVRELITTWDDNWALLAAQISNRWPWWWMPSRTALPLQSAMVLTCQRCAPNLQQCPGRLRASDQTWMPWTGSSVRH